MPSRSAKEITVRVTLDSRQYELLQAYKRKKGRDGADDPPVARELVGDWVRAAQEGQR